MLYLMDEMMMPRMIAKRMNINEYTRLVFLRDRARKQEGLRLSAAGALMMSPLAYVLAGTINPVFAILLIVPVVMWCRWLCIRHRINDYNDYVLTMIRKYDV